MTTNFRTPKLFPKTDGNINDFLCREIEGPNYEKFMNMSIDNDLSIIVEEKRKQSRKYKCQFKLDITRENLDRHLSHNPHQFTVLQKKFSGQCGDITIINDRIYFVNGYYTMPIYKIYDDDDYLWEAEGFGSKAEYIDYIECKFGTDKFKSVYVVIMQEVPFIDDYIENT